MESTEIVETVATTASVENTQTTQTMQTIQTIPQSEMQEKEEEVVKRLAYYLELSVAGVKFQEMSSGKQAEFKKEYGALLDDYTLLARESEDGTIAYIAGHYHGKLSTNQLFAQLDAIEETLEKTTANYVGDGTFLLIQPKGSKQKLDATFGAYANPVLGSKYIEYAMKKGLLINETAEPHISFYLFSEEYGLITETLPVPKEEAEKMYDEEPISLEDNYGFYAYMYVDGKMQAEYTGENVPKSVLDLAVKKCGYRFETPKDINAPIIEARLDCAWLDEPIYLEQKHFSKLEEILKSAKKDGIGACDYRAKLMITMETGEKMVIFKGTDDCGSLVFGSFGGYSLTPEADASFWEIFS